MYFVNVLFFRMCSCYKKYTKRQGPCYNMIMDTKVIIYSADWCAFCHAAKDYLQKKGVAFTEKNVEHDPSFAMEAVQKSNQAGIPVIDIDGTIIIGFDRPRIDTTLREKKLVA